MSTGITYTRTTRVHRDSQNKEYVPKLSKAWLKKDEDTTKFYTYILKLKDGQLYIGHSRELRDRLYEHKNDIDISTKGIDPKLIYFETSPTRAAAMCREKELRDIYKENPREIRRFILDFQEDIKAVDI